MAEKFGGMGLVPAGGKLGTPGPAARDQVESPVWLSTRRRQGARIACLIVLMQPILLLGPMDSRPSSRLMRRTACPCDHNTLALGIGGMARGAGSMPVAGQCPICSCF
jgi:hypothetical protein